MAENQVNPSTLESLSALVDNQVSELELRRLLKLTAADSPEGGELRDAWASFQLGRAAARGELPSGPYVDMSARIRAAIDEEGAHETPSAPVAIAEKQGARAWLPAVGRLSIAASVAAAVVLVAQQYNTLLPAADATIADVPAAQQSLPMPAGYAAPTLNARTVSTHDRYVPNPRATRQQLVPQRALQSPRDSAANRQLQGYLNQLMMEHAEHAAINSGRGILPFARVSRLEEE